ncbi:hypothetical protein ACVXHA_30235 [Escherichia coli]
MLLMALQQQMVTPLSLKRIAINSAQWRGDKARKSFINWRRYSKPG